MNRAQVAELLAYVAAFDRRTIGDADVLAWHEVLGDLDPDDAHTTARAWYTANHGMIAPADIRAGVRSIRVERIQRAQVNPPDGLDPDNPAAYQRWMLAALRATADGRSVPERTGLAAHPVAELVATVAEARSLPGRRRAPTPSRDAADTSRRLGRQQREHRRPVVDGRTDRERADAGRPVTVCHRCACDITPPDGWDPTDPGSPAVFCGRCQAERRAAGGQP